MKFDLSESIIKAKEAELKLKDSELQKSKERQFKFMYMFIVVFGMLFSGFLYFIIKAKHKKEKIQQVYNTEVRISKKVHDEVANDVYHIMTKLQHNKNIENNVLDDLEGVYNKTRDISKENNIIDVHEDFGNYLKDLLLSYKTSQVNIITKDIDKVNWKQLHETKKFALYRVLQELMTNMRKHSKATLVVVKFNQENRKISVSYKDNGIGCNLVKNNGLHNTENRMESLQGTITFDSQPNKGFSAHIIV